MQIRSKSVRNTLWSVAMLAVGAGAGFYAHANHSPLHGFAYSGSLKNNGVPVNGTHNVTFDLVDGAGANLGCPTDSRLGMTLSNGRFDAANLFGSCSSLDSLLRGQASLAIRIAVDGTVLFPDQPIGAVPLALHAKSAEIASPLIVKSADGLSCVKLQVPNGSMSLQTVTVNCATGAPVGLVINAGAYEIAGGTYLASCKDYRAYSGYANQGDAIYRIDPDGAGGNSPFGAYCDMTTEGGGWTLLMRVLGGSNVHVDNNGATGDAVPIPTSTSVSKFSTTQINTLVALPGANYVRIKPDTASRTTYYVRSVSDTDLWPPSLDSAVLTGGSPSTYQWVRTAYRSLLHAQTNTGGDLGTGAGGFHYYPTTYPDHENWFAKPIAQGGGFCVCLNFDCTGGSYVCNLNGTVWLQ